MRYHPVIEPTIQQPERPLPPPHPPDKTREKQVRVEEPTSPRHQPKNPIPPPHLPRNPQPNQSNLPIECEGEKKVKRKLNGMRRFTKILFPETTEQDLEKFDTVVEEAFKNNDGEFGIAAAKQWYKTQGNPMWGERAEIMQTEHENYITEHKYSLKNAGRAYLQPTADERFSLKGVETLNEKNLYKPKLRLLAKGMPVTTPPGFKRNGTTVWPAMRKKYLLLTS